MKDLLLFLWGFSPWILFGIIAEPPPERLKASIALCLALALVTGVNKLRKGFILIWGGVLFFVAMVLAINIGNSLWAMEHLGVLTNGTLALIAWAGLAIGRPFVLQYARESVIPEFRDRPEVLRAGFHLTIVWGLLFLLSTGFAFYKEGHPHIARWLAVSMAIGPVAAGITYTQIYKARAKRARERLLAGLQRPGPAE